MHVAVVAVRRFQLALWSLAILACAAVGAAAAAEPATQP
jgi:hypothetical protein